MIKKLAAFMTVFILMGCAAPMGGLSKSHALTGEYAANTLNYVGEYVLEEGTSPDEAEPLEIVSLRLTQDERYFAEHRDGGTSHGVFIWDKDRPIIYLINDTLLSPTFFVGKGYVIDTKTGASYCLQR